MELCRSKGKSQRVLEDPHQLLMDNPLPPPEATQRLDFWRSRWSTNNIKNKGIFLSQDDCSAQKEILKQVEETRNFDFHLHVGMR